MQKSDFCKKVELQPSCAKPSISIATNQTSKKLGGIQGRHKENKLDYKLSKH